MDECYEVARYNTHSKNVLDMIDQKNLWIKMHKATIGYDQTGFRINGRSHPSFQHHGTMTAKCLQYLQKASNPVHADVGTWRLWDDPLAVPRSSELHVAAQAANLEAKKADARAEDIQRVVRNLDNPIAEREAGPDDAIDEELRPPRTGHQQRDQRTKDDQKN